MSDEFKKYFIQYLKQYISALTENREEFFLSICDIEEELLDRLDMTGMTAYHVVAVDNRDYSKAVRLRNDIQIKKIVLLSGEGVKQIDSLKDFNEYSILPRNRVVLWKCLSDVFQVGLDRQITSFLEAILDQSEVTFCELLKYFCSCIEKGTANPEKLNKNLPMLGIWKCKSKEILRKGRISRMIRASKFAFVENRLTKAIMENKIDSPRKERNIANLLSLGNIQKILETNYYEEVEDFFKNMTRTSGTNDDNSLDEIDSHYSFSYEYKILERDTNDIAIIEEEWIRDEKNENAESELDLNWICYQPSPDALRNFKAQIENLVINIKNMDLSEAKLSSLLGKLEELSEQFIENWEALIEATPICLQTFCRMTFGYVQSYMELLSSIMLDEKIRLKLTGVQVIPNLLLLWCVKEDGRIKMPFYHPIAAFHYMRMQRLYEDIVQNQEAESFSQLKTRVEMVVAKKIGMLFPVEFIEVDKRQYMIDYTTVSQGGDIVFHDVQSGFGYSVLDFRIIQSQVVDYIKNHPFLTEINVALLDICDLSGLLQMVAKIRECYDSDECNISRVTFRILSAKEEELKKNLAQMAEAVGLDDIIRFRFGKSSYNNDKNSELKKNIREKEAELYELKQIIMEADMTILADSSILYYEPKMVLNRTGNNSILKNLEQMDVSNQVEEYFAGGNCDISILWDTLQHISIEQDEGFWYWKSKAINNQTLSTINQLVSEFEDKTIVVLSSNKDILSEINRTKYIHAHKRKYNGKSITILNFSGRNGIKKLAPLEARISYSIKDFYYEVLELSNTHQDIIFGVQDIYLSIYMKNEIIQCVCRLIFDDNSDTAEYSIKNISEVKDEWAKCCSEWIEWQFGEFFRRDNIIGKYCQELWANQWYEEAHSLPAVLLVEKLCKGNHIQVHLEESWEQNKKYKTQTDCMESVKIHDLIGFIHGKRAVDERTVSQFRERFEEELLERVIQCEEAYHLLDKMETDRMKEIYEMMKGK